MAIFYLLPPRTMVAQRWGCFWRTVLPGAELPGDQDGWPELLADSAQTRPGVFVVFRDELADPADPVTSLRDGFGAEQGDQLIHVHWIDPGEPPRVRVGRIPSEKAHSPGSEVAAFGYNEQDTDPVLIR